MPEDSLNTQRRYRLLIVEDDAEMLEILNGRFRRIGFEVVAVCDPQSALASARAREFHAALIDRSLPGMNGMQLLRELLALAPDLRPVVLSGYADPAYEEDALHSGACAYLRKPCRLATIEATVHDAMFGPPRVARRDSEAAHGARRTAFGSSQSSLDSPQRE